MRRFGAVIPVLLIVLAPPAMLWTLWLNPVSAGEDDLGYYYPLRVLVGQALREGRWPVQNRLEATGAPLLADPQSAVMFPATWLFAALPGPLAYTLSIYLGFSLAGGGAYLYLRRLGLVRPAALFGAVAFMFGGFLVGHRVHLGILHAAAFLPWGLWCIEGLRRKLSVFPWLVPVVYLALTAGHWPTFIHVSMVWLAYFCLRARPLWRSLGVCAATGALAALLAGPQLLATMDLLAEATRQRIGFATAGENSFFPLASVLALFPYLMGNRSPNFFAQPWWGPWHQCEMLGYVGLSTLALAGAAVWRLYRRPGEKQKVWRIVSHTFVLRRGRRPAAEVPPPPGTAANSAAVAPVCDGLSALRPLVRVWTWLAIGAAVWMLGYYLPTYRLIHMLPVMGILRCPARMVVAMDLALATLAAIAIHLLSQRDESALGGERLSAGEPVPRENASAHPSVPASGTTTGDEAKGKEEEEETETDLVARLTGTVRRATCKVLPLAMVGTLAGLALAAAGLRALGWWGDSSPFTVGGSLDALKAASPLNPAVWTAGILLGATVAVLLWWLRSPGRRSAALVALLLADLFLLTRFVDVPSPVRRAELGTPPAGAWLRAHAGDGNTYRVWGLSEAYFHRQRELLLPKTCCLYDVATIASYGPFQSPAHAHLLGFNICGYTRDWAGLLRGNRLLSLYNVRYILAEANSDFEHVLQAVRVTAEPAREDGPDLIGRTWVGHRVECEANLWRLQTPYLWDPSEAKAPLSLEPNTIYRISLEARGPDDGAANFLRADVFQAVEGRWFQPEAWGLTVPAEQIGPAWRHFRWTFQTPAELPSPLGFRLLSMSERPIEVCRLSLRKLSQWESPESPGDLSVGQQVYRKVAECPSLEAGDAPVTIYENLLARREQPILWERSDEESIERAKWNSHGILEMLTHSVMPTFPPYAGLPSSYPPKAMTRLTAFTTAPAAAAYLLAVFFIVRRRRRPPETRRDAGDKGE